MMKQFLISLLYLLWVNVFAQERTYEKELYDIEKAFSDDAQSQGFRMANIRYAAPDAIVFRPFEINAIEWSEKLKGQDSSYRLSWYPSIIQVSAAGDLGYGSGPFENVSTRPGDNNKVLNRGQFCTVWKRQLDGVFKFIMDFGSGQLPENEFVRRESEYTPVATSSKKAKKGTADWNDIIEIEKAYNKACQSKGDLAALLTFASEGIIFFYQTMFYARTIGVITVREDDAFESRGGAAGRTTP